jgi:hypothetical protein
MKQCVSSGTEMRRVADPDPHGSALFLVAVSRSGSALEREKLDPDLDTHYSSTVPRNKLRSFRGSKWSRGGSVNQ